MVTDREVFRKLITEAAADVVVFKTCEIQASAWTNLKLLRSPGRPTSMSLDSTRSVSTDAAKCDYSQESAGNFGINNRTTVAVVVAVCQSKNLQAARCSSPTCVAAIRLKITPRYGPHL